MTRERRPDFAKKALNEALRVGAGPPPLEAEPLFYGIAGFCEAHGISRSGLYALWRQGIGPKVIKLGKAVKISREAAAQWRAERQAATDQAA